VWIGVFNLMVVTQFWSFANDVYSKGEGERSAFLVFIRSAPAAAAAPSTGLAATTAS